MQLRQGDSLFEQQGSNQLARIHKFILIIGESMEDTCQATRVRCLTLVVAIHTVKIRKFTVE